MRAVLNSFVEMIPNSFDSILTPGCVLSQDLDPNKSLASQIGNSGKDENSTIDSTYVSMEVSVKSVVSDGTLFNLVFAAACRKVLIEDTLIRILAKRVRVCN